MVYTERTDKCLTSTKDNADQSKTRSSTTSSPSPPATKATSGHSSGAWSSQASNADKWRFNNMVIHNREKFNNMHYS